MNNLSDIMLRQYIDQIFNRYDYNRNGTLDPQELHTFLSDLFQMCGMPRYVSYQEAYMALMQMDSNHDGQVNKYELFNLFKHMTHPNYQPMSYPAGGYNNPGGFSGMGSRYSVPNQGYGGMGNIRPGYGSGNGNIDPSWNLDWR